MTRILYLIGFLLVSGNLFGQTANNPYQEFGKISVGDLELEHYDKDPEAPAVVLFERGYNKVERRDDKVWLVKNVHRRIKVFNPDQYDAGTVEIPFYSAGNSPEKVVKIKAMTHNGKRKIYVNSDNIYENQVSSNTSIKTFAFADVQPGSVLEYTYEIQTPYFTNFGDWHFQWSIPKRYSEFVSEMPGNWTYSKTLIGTEKLDKNEVSVKRDCFSLPNVRQLANCELGVYAMEYVPAFREEDYMLASSNYRSRLAFELKEFRRLDGVVNKFTRDWDDIDKQLRFDKDLGRQLSYKNYFQKELPADVLNINDPLEKAVKVYAFIQNHFKWNGEYRYLSDIRVKEAYEEKTGNGAEINLALINALESVDIPAHIAILSTRKNGIPTQLNPVLTEFNHVVAYTEIGGKKYLMDASSRHAPFGVLPFEDLNGVARVMDFKQGSFWHTVLPNPKNVLNVSAQLSLTEEGKVNGQVREIYIGHEALRRRDLMSEKGQEYKAYRSAQSPDGLLISGLEVENFDDKQGNLIETYTMEQYLEEVGDKLLMSPFLTSRFFTENPFKMESRSYPVDLGYPRVYSSNLKVDLGGYSVNELPESRVVNLPESSGTCQVVYAVEGNVLLCRFVLKLNQFHFKPFKYQSLKEFFDTAVGILNSDLILLQRG